MSTPLALDQTFIFSAMVNNSDTKQHLLLLVMFFLLPGAFFSEIVLYFTISPLLNFTILKTLTNQ